MGWAQLIRPFPADEARKGRRFKVLLPIALKQGDEPVHASLIELSQHGAQARTLSPMEQASVLITWEGKQLPAQVAWRRGDRIGLVFDRPLTPLQLSAMLSD